MKLTKREQEVIHLRYVENKSLKEIAEIYGVTKERIRQVEAKALWKTHKNNPEHSCDDCYHYWGTVPTCHNHPHMSKPCDDWRPKTEIRYLSGGVELMDSHDCDTCRYRDHTNGQLPCSRCKGGDCWESEEDD